MHTPGPWVVAIHEDYPDQVVIVEEVGNGRILAVVDDVDEQDQANAKAMAAVPDLITVAEKILAEFDDKIVQRHTPIAYMGKFEQLREIIHQIKTT